MSIAGNTFVGTADGLDVAAWPDNDVYADATPRGALSFVRPNAYEPERAHLVVFNWDLADTVDVDLSAWLAEGDGFEMYDAQNYFGDPLITAAYEGPVAIPMTPGPAAQVVGTPATPYVHTSAEFGAFVLVRTDIAGGTDDGGSGESGGLDESGGGDEGPTTASADGDESATVSASAGTATMGSDGDGGASGGEDSASGCGCAASSPPPWGWLALGVWIRRRRRA
jgi:uncharacterized protein (TIGR03382 family)